MDKVFAARQTQEKVQGQNFGLHVNFLELTKAFDTVSRDELWKIMAEYS